MALVPVTPPDYPPTMLRRLLAWLERPRDLSRPVTLHDPIPCGPWCSHDDLEVR